MTAPPMTATQAATLKAYAAKMRAEAKERTDAAQRGARDAKRHESAAEQLRSAAEMIEEGSDAALAGWVNPDGVKGYRDMLIAALGGKEPDDISIGGLIGQLAAQLITARRERDEGREAVDDMSRAIGELRERLEGTEEDRSNTLRILEQIGAAVLSARDAIPTDEMPGQTKRSLDVEIIERLTTRSRWLLEVEAMLRRAGLGDVVDEEGTTGAMRQFVQRAAAVLTDRNNLAARVEALNARINYPGRIDSLADLRRAAGEVLRRITVRR